MSVPDYAHWARAEQAKKPVARPIDPITARLDILKGKMLDGVDAVLDQIAKKHAPADPLPLVVARRQMAQILGAPKFCSRIRCKRTGACCGEPKHCLLIALPLLPPELIQKLALSVRKTRRARAR